MAVVVRLDALGDFFIWLQSGAVEIARFAKQSGRRSVLCANTAYADYARYTGLWDEVMAIEPARMMRNPLYRLRMLTRIRRCGAELLIQSRASRVFLQEDAIARTCGATYKVGSAGTTINSLAWLREWGNRFYDRLIPIDEGREIHEVIRNEQFTQALTGSPGTRFMPPEGKGERPAEETVAVVLGAGEAGRVWPLDKLANLIRHIRERYPGLRITLLGVKSDRLASQELERQAGGALDNRVGATDLLTYVRLISQASLVVCNDSSAYHIGMALGRSIVCFLGGGHYGWFAPYPSTYNLGRRVCVLNVPMECYWCNWNCKYPTDAAGSFRCVTSINLAAAVAAVDTILTGDAAQS